MLNTKKVEDILNVLNRDNSELNRNAVINDMIIGGVFVIAAAGVAASAIATKLATKNKAYYPDNDDNN